MKRFLLLPLDLFHGSVDGYYLKFRNLHKPVVSFIKKLMQNDKYSMANDFFAESTLRVDMGKVEVKMRSVFTRRL